MTIEFNRYLSKRQRNPDLGDLYRHFMNTEHTNIVSGNEHLNQWNNRDNGDNNTTNNNNFDDSILNCDNYRTAWYIDKASQK